MNILKKGWKAVYKRSDNIYYSVIQHSESGGIYYVMNQWVYPKKQCGPLAVFTTEESAAYFIKDRYFCTYFPCFYEPTKLEFVWCCVLDLFTRKIARRLASLPENTALANKVMLFMPIQIA